MNKLSLLGLLIAVTVSTQLFQNCGQMGSLETLDLSSRQSMSSNADDTDHPSTKTLVAPKQKILLVNRTYVEAIMRDVFTYSQGLPPSFNFFVMKWISYRAAQYGQPCDPYGTRSGADCGGSVAAGASLPMQVEDTAIRQAYVSQFCENILGMDQGVQAILEKLPSKAVAPNAAGLAELYGLFYRGDPPTSAEIATLLDLDRSLAAAGEPVLERWRAASLQVCESPAWQLQ